MLESEKLVNLFLSEIKSKKQIESLEDNFILEKLEKYFLRNGDIRKKIELEFKLKNEKIVKSKYFKEIVKKIREEIGIIYGCFLTKDFGKKEKILETINKIDIEHEELNGLLKLHKSTRERIDFYEEIYSKIFLWYKPNQIGDLACGLNPISILFMKKYLEKYPKYFASDLNPKDMNYLNFFFHKFDLKAKAKSYDITNLKILEDKNFIECDLVFLFKAIDSFESVKKNISKELLKGIKSKRVVVSFPRKSLVSGKNFKEERRNWFFNFLKEMNWNYETFEVENEMFILIKK
ncbi:MAG: hypothetical protein KC589_04780 [Nanoarchaeota archaeon]|nr:hypothetical protein [Nanoarchaeota archaeon]